MGKSLKDSNKPLLKKVSRREFIEMIALRGSTIALAASGISFISCSRPDPQTLKADIPVRNPAFREVPGDLDNHKVLYCQTDKGEYLAYDLNYAGYMIWRRCAEHLEFVKGAGKNISEIASEIADKVDGETLRDFVILMYDKGLLYSGKKPNQAYFVYEERLNG